MCVLISWCISLGTHFSVVYASGLATGRLHSDVVQRLVHAPLSFFDETSVGSILSLFSLDLSHLDSTVYFATMWFMMGFNFSCFIVVVTIVLVPWTAAPFAFALVLLFVVVRSGNGVKRALGEQEQVMQAPVMEHLQESLAALHVIRADKSDIDVGRTDWAREGAGVAAAAAGGGGGGAGEAAEGRGAGEGGGGGGGPAPTATSPLGRDSLRFAAEYDRLLNDWTSSVYAVKKMECWSALRCNLIGSFLYVMCVAALVPGRINGTLTPGEGGFIVVNGAFLNLLLNMTIEFRWAAPLVLLSRHSTTHPTTNPLTHSITHPITYPTTHPPTHPSDCV